MLEVPPLPLLPLTPQLPLSSAPMSLDQIKKVAVLGAGTMGNGIAHVFARAGYNVILRDVETRFLDRGLETIGKNLDREVKKEKIAASEKPLILASNTSSISITQLAAQTSRPEKFIGMHFMNPVPVMALVEVIRGLATSDETFQITTILCERLEKKPVAVNDAPGFVSNRVLMPLINEAAFAVMEGVATPEAVDAVMKMGMNHPMGPLELADFIGLDVCLNILRVLQNGFGDPKYRPCPLLRKYVAAGWLGRKSGRGFYKY